MQMKLPGIGLPAMVAITIGAALLVTLPLTDYDYFWHMETGEWIVTHGWRLPEGEPFSSTVAGSPWLVQGWLFDAVQYALHRQFGDLGVRTMFVALLVSTWALVHATVKPLVPRESHALLLTLLCASAAATYMAPRPLAATNLAFAFVLFALLRHRATARLRWLLALPPVFALWANLHFGYVTGLGLVLLFAVATALERLAPSRDGPPEPGALSWSGATLLLLACTLATCLNPYGWRVLAETFSMSSANMNTDIVDWMSPDFRHWRSQAFLLPMALMFFARALATRRPSWLDLVVPLALVGAALYSQRHIPLASIALAPMLARAFADWAPATIGSGVAQSVVERWRGSGGRELGDVQYRLNLVVAAGVAIGAIALEPTTSAWQQRRTQALLPVKAADFVLANELRGPMLNDYHTGGYLIHKLHPRVPVFIDGRYNPYLGKVLNDHDTLQRLERGWQDVLERYEIRLAVLARPHGGLAGAMVASGRYRLVYADAAFGVLVRNDGSHPDLPNAGLEPRGIAKETGR